MNTLLCLAGAMTLGLLLTRLAKKVNLPNVTAYLIAGLVVGPYCLNLFDESVLAGVSQLTSIALGFIAFSIGGEFKRESLKRVGGKAMIITVFQSLCALALVDVVRPACAHTWRDRHGNRSRSNADGGAAIPRARHDDEHAAFRRRNG